jgi:hypothetical protein
MLIRIQGGTIMQGSTKGVPILISGTLTGAADTNVPSSSSVVTYVANEIAALAINTWQFVTINSNVTTTSASAVDITGHSFPVVAHSKYRLSFYARIGCSGTGGMYFGWTFPSDGGLNRMLWGTSTNTSTMRNAGAGTTTGGSTLSSIPLNAAATSIGMYVEELIIETVSAGTVQAQFASVVSGQTSTVFSNLSFIEFIKIA